MGTQKSISLKFKIKVTTAVLIYCSRTDEHASISLRLVKKRNTFISRNPNENALPGEASPDNLHFSSSNNV